MIVFICNHCPYVKAVIDRLVADARLLMGEGVGFAAISSNDAASYPEDSFAKMGEFAKKHGFPFPYLHDETQDVARAYGAVCTPDFFGFDGELEAQISRPAGRGPRLAASAERAPRTPGRDARDRRRSPSAGEPGALDRLLDQVEAGPGIDRGGSRAFPRWLKSALLDGPSLGGLNSALAYTHSS